MNDKPTERVVRAAVAACRSFARYQKRFFADRAGWRGWENWLTVDICRRLNDKAVCPFPSYTEKLKRKHMDLFVNLGRKAGVEIKVNYIDDREASQKTELPDRILGDKIKLGSLARETFGLLLISTCFDSKKGLRTYRSRISRRLSISGWNAEWHDCSNGDGHNLLLALTRVPKSRHQTRREVE